MAKLIFEEAGGDRMWIHIDEDNLEICIMFHGVEENDYERTLVCGEEVPVFLEFLQRQYEDALEKVRAKNPDPLGR